MVMLTFLPALLLIGGRWVVLAPLPGRRERPIGRPALATDREPVARRARVVWVATTLGLIALAIGLTQLNTTTLGEAELFTTRPASVAAQDLINRHFPAGLGSPATIFTTVGSADQVAAAARARAGGGRGATAARPATPRRRHRRAHRDRRSSTAGWSCRPPSPSPPTATPPSRPSATCATAVHAVPGADAVVGGFTAIDLDTATPPPATAT